MTWILLVALVVLTSLSWGVAREFNAFKWINVFNAWVFYACGMGSIITIVVKLVWG